MSTYPVTVSGISPTTTQSQLFDFFTFCGKISSIDDAPIKGTATINFEKPSAARTALMLNGGTLDGATLTVSSDAVHTEDEVHHDTAGEGIEQSDKPRAGIAAEYLAKGYALSDQVLQRAIEMDGKQGISKRFLDYIQSIDKSIGERALGPEKTLSAKAQSTVDAAVQKAKEVDEQKGISKIASDYYTRAISSPFGQKVRLFYTNTSKQVHDIHEEARRIAAEEKAKSGGATPQPTGGSHSIPDPTTQAAPTVN